MADMVWRPAFRDVDPEREVVLEEIAMYEDDPQDTVFDVLGEAVFGGHPLGRPIIGRAPVIRDTPVDVISTFHATRYVPGSVVVAAAGSVDHDQVVELAERTLGASGNGSRTPPSHAAPADLRSNVRFQRKDTEQCHVCLGATGIHRRDDRRFAIRVLDAIFGGLSSSRLFQAVREERGLAYSVYSFSGQFSDTDRLACISARAPTTSPRRCAWCARSSTACARRRPARRSSTAPARTSRRAWCWRWSRRGPG
jgi:predicted Zn-dependent peptidase